MNYYDYRHAFLHGAAMDFSSLKGKTLASIHKEDEMQDALIFRTVDDEVFIMSHYFDCCESVGIESIVGDLKDLIGSPITLAEKATSDAWPDSMPKLDEWLTFTWTFYKLATIKGYVDIRWLGTSNGYYSEEVNFFMVGEQNKQKWIEALNKVDLWAKK